MVFLAHWREVAPGCCTWLCPHFCGRPMWNMKSLPAAPFQLLWKVQGIMECESCQAALDCVWVYQSEWGSNIVLLSPGLAVSEQQWLWSFPAEGSTQTGWFVSRSHYGLLKVNKREGTEVTTTWWIHLLTQRYLLPEPGRCRQREPDGISPVLR